ncbi:hypothetical protein [Streptomyces sp. NPDC048551]|uniref:hypothetical protein n=1 Tax=Streptomyces sp. NPDC048551 TaxID=3155758 RepID=UPI0034127F39
MSGFAEEDHLAAVSVTGFDDLSGEVEVRKFRVDREEERRVPVTGREAVDDLANGHGAMGR